MNWKTINIDYVGNTVLALYLKVAVIFLVYQVSKSWDWLPLRIKSSGLTKFFCYLKITLAVAGISLLLAEGLSGGVNMFLIFFIELEIPALLGTADGLKSSPVASTTDN